jgi:hypothetical protein
MNELSSVARGKRFRRISLALAVAACLYGGVATAQQTTADIIGSAGQPGASVRVENVATGVTRTITVGSNGSFRASALPPGHYQVVEMQNGQAVITREVDLAAGRNVQVSLNAAAPEQLGAITVTGAAIPQIDVNSVESTDIFTAKQLQQVPVAQNETAVALLAPGTVRADQSFGNLAVFNGASAAENSYYVNGFNVTNEFQSLTYSRIPFEAIAQQEVKSGGYGAQFGYSTGGVLSVITKQGTNTWEGGVSLAWAPDSLREHNPNTYLNNGLLYENNHSDSDTDIVTNVWLGGPIIKDRLFIYGIYSQEREYFNSYTNNQTTAPGTRERDRNPFWLVKLNWNITGNNLLEYTGFSDLRHRRLDYYPTEYAADGSVSKGPLLGSEYLQNGGRTDILKYTGYWTDNFTLSAMYGKLRYDRFDEAYSSSGVHEFYNGNPLDFNQPGCPFIADDRTGVLDGIVAPYPSCSFVGSLDLLDGRDTKKIWSLDAEWKLGPHDLHAGYSHTDWNTITGNALEGGAEWIYFTRPDATAPDSPDPSQNYAEKVQFSTGAAVEIVQKAYYLEDDWNITDNFLARIGVRNDSFDNRNGLGQTYVSQDNIWQPRLGFSWDVHGDSTLKVYGSAGEYSLPIAANVALRGASASVFSFQDFFYTSVDPVTGRPLGLSPATGSPIYLTDPYFINGETGNTPSSKSVADANLEPYKQREFILGFQKALSNSWVVGLRGIHRKLDNAIDDTCDWRPFQKYGIETLGLDVGAYPPPTSPGCFLFNPGRGLTVDVDLDGNGTLEHVVLTPQDLGEPHAKRKYDALEFTFAHNWADRWFLQGSFTWSHSRGNTEGLVKSDIGQTDTGTTEDFDYPEFSVGSYGSLPNDRRYTLKLYGAFRPTDEWLLGANFLMESGRPENCIGYNPEADAYIQYGAAYFYCPVKGSTTTVGPDGSAIGMVVPRGSVGRTGYIYNLDLNFRYTPHWAKGLTLGLTIFNVFNNHTPTEVDERGTTGRGAARSTYLIPTNFQTPRSFRFEGRYDFSL